MATRSIPVYIDDLTGEEIPHEEFVTVTFSVDNDAYVLETTESGKKALEEALAPFISVARTTPVRKLVRSIASEAGSIRVWARENGYEISDLGRIPQRIVDAYHSREK